MKFPNYIRLLKTYKVHIDNSIDVIVNSMDLPQKLSDMIHYALFPGRRMRSSIYLSLLKEIKGRDIKIAACIEMLHRASLIVDDILDEDDFRRGNESFHYKYGKDNAVIVSHLLTSYCVKELQHFKVSHIYNKMAIGQCNEFYSNSDMDLNRYNSIASNKTGKLFGLAFYIAAIRNKYDKETIKCYISIGDNFGTFFQIGNDISDTLYQNSKDRKSAAENFSYPSSFPIAWLISENILNFKERYNNADIRSCWGSVDAMKKKQFQEYLQSARDQICLNKLVHGSDLIGELLDEISTKVFWTHKYSSLVNESGNLTLKEASNVR